MILFFLVSKSKNDIMDVGVSTLNIFRNKVRCTVSYLPTCVFKIFYFENNT
jgi:hypothetical protein